MASIEIPATCLGTEIFDVNRDWPCKRAAFIAYLNNEVREIEKTERRLARTSNQYRVRNLAAWIEDATARLSRNVARIPECSGKHEH